MTTFVLEDHPDRQAWFRSQFPDALIVDRYTEAVAAMSGQRFDEVWLDFDIAGTGHNGSDVAWFMAHTLPVEMRPATVYVHSSNNAGARAIMQTLERSGMRLVREAWPPTVSPPAPR